MILVGLDPGTKKSGWCRVSVAPASLTGARSVTYLDGGLIPSDARAIAELLANVDGVAIEKLEGYAFGGKGKGGGVVAGLIASSAVAGLISGIAIAKSVPVVEMSARDWRRTVLGQPSATDALIKLTIPRLVRCWPRRSSNHVRDAAGVVLGSVWSRRWTGLRVRITTAIGGER